MKKIPIMHDLNDKNSLLNNYLLALIPLLIFGFYKNGIILYNNALINFKNILIPLYFYIISIIIAVIVSFFTKENIKENIVIALICTSSISLNTNMLIYPILLFILLFIIKYLNTKKTLTFNYNTLMRIFLNLSLLIGTYSYLNIGEKLAKFNYNIWDIFVGLGHGGLANTSVLFLIISFIILSFNKYYKKIIPIAATISYLTIIISYIFITKNYSLTSDYLLNGMAYFSFIFFGADLIVSPYSNKGMLFYGIIIGLLTSLLTVILKAYYLEASFISIFICSLFIPLINKVTNKKYLHP